MTPMLPSPWSHGPSTPSHHDACEWSDQEDKEQDDESDQEYWYEAEARDTQVEDEHEICKTETDAAMEVSTDIGGADDEQREEADDAATDVEVVGEEKLSSTDDHDEHWYAHRRQSRWPNFLALSSDDREAYSL